MTPFRKRATPITKRMTEDMLVRNLAEGTIDSYTYHVDRFAKHFGKLPEDLGHEQIREFQLWMIQVKLEPGDTVLIVLEEDASNGRPACLIPVSWRQHRSVP